MALSADRPRAHQTPCLLSRSPPRPYQLQLPRPACCCSRLLTHSRQAQRSSIVTARSAHGTPPGLARRPPPKPVPENHKISANSSTERPFAAGCRVSSSPPAWQHLQFPSRRPYQFSRNHAPRQAPGWAHATSRARYAAHEPVALPGCPGTGTRPQPRG